MKATYRISEADYVSALKLASQKPFWRDKLPLWIAVVLMVACFSYAELLRFPTLIIVALLIILWDFLAALWITPIFWKKEYRQYKMLHEVFTIKIDHNQLIRSSQNMHAHIAFSDILKWRENDRLILFYLNPTHFFIIPKRIGEQGFDLDQIMTKLNKND